VLLKLKDSTDPRNGNAVADFKPKIRRSLARIAMIFWDCQNRGQRRQASYLEDGV